MEALFQDARTVLLREQETRENVIRLSRDITAVAKKLIFAVHRDNRDQVEAHKQDIGSKLTTLEAIYDKSKYSGTVSGALEELSEALTFDYYVNNNELMTYEQFKSEIESGCGGASSFIEFHHYFLGLFDLTGEVMRLCINSLAAGTSATKTATDGWQFLQSLYRHMSGAIDVHPNLNFHSGVSSEYNFKGTPSVHKKMEVFKQSLYKVQSALCDVYVRGDEALSGEKRASEFAGSDAKRIRVE
ncbi:hypothetical protein DICA3_D21902 [Diutina catenulata]